MAQLIDRLNFAKSNTVVKFKAEQSVRDDKGNRITSTYATKDDLSKNLEDIVKAKDASKDSERNAKASETNATIAAARIAEIIDNAVRYEGIDIDTILAASEVASECAKNTSLIPNVDAYHAQASNGNVNANNGNVDAIVEYLDAIVATIKSIIGSAVFVGVDGIQIASILDNQIALAKQKMLKAVSNDGAVAGAWDFPISLC